MNILLLNVNIGHPQECGGIESHSRILGQLLAGSGHRVTLGCWKEGSVEIGSGNLVLPSKRIAIRNSGDPAAVFKITKVLLKEDIDIIIANSGKEYWPAAIAAKISGAGVIFVRHQTDRLRKTTCMLINSSVERVVAVSSAVRNALVKSGVSADKIDLIHNSVNPEWFDPARMDRNEARTDLGIGENDIVVGTAVNLDRGKGIYEMLSAASLLADRYPSLKLLFVGGGPERDNLEKAVEDSLMKGRVILAGRRRDMEKMYAAMDIFVLPSTCEEAFGTVLIEAMAMGKPVIGTAVGGIPDIIHNNVNGILIPPQDADAIADAIARCLDDQEVRSKIASEGRNIARLNFSVDVMGEKFERLIQMVYLRKKKHRPSGQGE